MANPKPPNVDRWVAALEGFTDAERNVLRTMAHFTLRMGAANRVKRDALEARIAAIETQHPLKYCGTWQRANVEAYHRNNAVTHAGSLWIAVVEPPKGAPGSSSDWQLAVKGGGS